MSEPFDAERFARDTIKSIEYTDAAADVLERRVIRLEQLVAARWPRSMFLRRRLAREIRASVSGFDPEYIPENDFMTRRYEWACHKADEAPEVRRRRDS